MGGSPKIDSLQNLITMRLDLHCAWDNYEFGIDPNVSRTPLRYFIFDDSDLPRTITASLPS